jgi:hypothetical protein
MNRPRRREVRRAAERAFEDLVSVVMGVTSGSPQAETHRVTVESIMRTAAFRRGVADVRVGRRPRFDDHKEADSWHYERGRQFGAIAPRNLPVMLGKRLNPAALEFFDKDIC